MKNNQLGRSMVEMLGVLAIIGVLSAGALAGYSKAMFKHKVNQSIDIFQGVLQRLIELDQSNLGDDFVINNAEAQEQYGLIQNCQKVEGSAYGDSSCQLPIGYLDTDLYFYEGMLNGIVLVRFNDANSCIAFSSAPWDQVIPQDFLTGGDGVGFLTVADDMNVVYGYKDGVFENTWDVAKIAQECSICNDDLQLCYLELMIHVY